MYDKRCVIIIAMWFKYRAPLQLVSAMWQNQRNYFCLLSKKKSFFSVLIFFKCVIIKTDQKGSWRWLRMNACLLFFMYTFYSDQRGKLIQKQRIRKINIFFTFFSLRLPLCRCDLRSFSTFFRVFLLSLKNCS